MNPKKKKKKKKKKTKTKAIESLSIENNSNNRTPSARREVKPYSFHVIPTWIQDLLNSSVTFHLWRTSTTTTLTSFFWVK